MLLKKTEELGLTFSSTQFAHVLKVLLYTVYISISSYSVAPSLKDPRLFSYQFQQGISDKIRKQNRKMKNTYNTFMVGDLIHQM